MLSKLPKSVLLLLYTSGVYICYLAFGIAQEKVHKSSYRGPDGRLEKFDSTLFLLFIQCIFNSGLAYIGLLLYPSTKKLNQKAVATISLTYLSAMAFSNAALDHIDYPTQVLGKTSKPVFVLIFGLLFLRGSESYSVKKIVMCMFICVGISFFMYNKSESAKVEVDVNYQMGYVLVLASLMCDGLNGLLTKMEVNKQRRAEQSVNNLNSFPTNLDKNSKGEVKSPFPIMFYNNLWALTYLFVALIITGQLFHQVWFCATHPMVIIDLVVFGACSAFGQIFIYSLLTNFDPLVCSLVTTTRKFFTILASVLWFGHQVNSRQWISVFLVFFGLFYPNIHDYLFNKKSKADKDE